LLDSVVTGLFGISSPPFPEVSLSYSEKSKFEKYFEGVKNRPDIHFIPFAFTEFGDLGGHVSAFVTKLAKHAAAS
jgi:hypothetical protein